MPWRADADGDEFLRTASAPDDAGDVTLMGWAKRVTSGGAWEMAFDLSNASNRYWYMGPTNTTDVWTMFLKTNLAEQMISGPDLTSDTGWYCYVMMRDGDDFRMWYRSATATSWTTGSVSNTGNFVIGQVKLFDDIFNNEWFNGSIVSVKVWERAFTEDEAFAESMQFVPIHLPIWGWYPMGGRVVGDSGIDYSGNGRDLTEAGSLVIDNDGPPIIWDARPGRLILPAAGAAAQTLTGVLFARPPAFIAGTVSPTNVIDGVLFSRPPAFIAGTVTPTNLLSGVLFTRPPAFIPGVVTPGGVTVTGVLFTRPPSFIAGTITPTNLLSGVVFARPPTFIAGTITPTNLLSGVLFARPPSFIAGVVTPGGVQLDGVLFARPPTFIAGVVTQGRTLDGVLFTRPPTFIAGTITPGGVTVTGVLFTRPPSFIAGVVSPTNLISGVLFTRPPTFIAGTITPTFTIAGVLFTRPPSFIVGAISPTNLISGVLFTRPPTFIAGVVTLATVQLDGVLFLRPPTFIAGTLSLEIQNLIGVLFLRPPNFIVGVISLQVQLPPTGLRDMGVPARTYVEDGSRTYSGSRSYSDD